MKLKLAKFIFNSFFVGLFLIGVAPTIIQTYKTPPPLHEVMFGFGILGFVFLISYYLTKLKMYIDSQDN